MTSPVWCPGKGLVPKTQDTNFHSSVIKWAVTEMYASLAQLVILKVSILWSCNLRLSLADKCFYQNSCAIWANFVTRFNKVEQFFETFPFYYCTRTKVMSYHVDYKPIYLLRTSCRACRSSYESVQCRLLCWFFKLLWVNMLEIIMKVACSPMKSVLNFANITFNLFTINLREINPNIWPSTVAS